MKFLAVVAKDLRMAPAPLEGWKQVAHYLGVTERTAQMWARKRAMPIHRSAPGKSRIWSEPGEIDLWKTAARSKEARTASRKAVTVRLPEADYQRVKLLCHAGTVQELVLHAVS